MTFKKQFPKEDFLNVLSLDWQKTRAIADKVGCKNLLATNTLLSMYKVVHVGYLELSPCRLSHFGVYNAVEQVERRWTKGGKSGTREWRLKELK